MTFRISLLLCLSMILITVIYAVTDGNRENDDSEIKLREKRGMRWHERMYRLRTRGRHMRNDSDDDTEDRHGNRRRGCRRGHRRGHRHRMRGGNGSRSRNSDERGYRWRGMHDNNESREITDTNSYNNGSQFRGHAWMHHSRGHRRGDWHHRVHHRGDNNHVQDMESDSSHLGERNFGFNHLDWIHGVHQDDGQDDEQGELHHEGNLDPETGLPRLSIHAQRKVNFLSTAQNHFTVSLHRQIGRPVTDIVYSPYGIFQFLSMMYIGSRTHTAFQMRRVLHLVGMGRHVHHPVRYQNIVLNNSGNGVVEATNILLLRPDINLTTSFLHRMELSYQCHFTGLDLDHPNGPEAPINELVANQTHSHIPAVINPGVINQNTAMVPVNAMYFKAKWKTSFLQSTSSQMFSKTATEQVPVPMMQVENSFKISTLPGHSARVLELPYEGGHFSMLVILPDDVDGLASIEEGLTVEILSTSLEAAVSARVNVSLPKFRLDSSLSLKEKLQNMGMTKAFDPRFASFASMTRSNNVYITDVIQRAVVEVDEEGSQSATATDSGSSSPVSQFKCGHPFLFIIRDNVSKVNLFIGKFAGGV